MINSTGAVVGNVGARAKYMIQPGPASTCFAEPCVVDSGRVLCRDDRNQVVGGYETWCEQIGPWWIQHLTHTMECVVDDDVLKVTEEE